MPVDGPLVLRQLRRPAGALAALAVAALVACGDDSTLTPVSTPPPSTSAGPAVSTSSTPEGTVPATTAAATASPATSGPPATTGTATTESAAPAGPVMADAYQVRSDEAVGGQFQVQVTNTGDEELTVVGVRLQSPGFEQLDFEPRTTHFGVGQTTDLTTKYGPVVCDADLASSGAGLQIEHPDGTADEIDVPFQSLYVLDRIYRRECAAKAFAEAVDMHLGPMEVTTSAGRSVMSTTLVLERRGTEDAVVVEDTRGSVLITPLLTSEAGRELAVGEDQVDVPYEFEVRSCMPHLLADVKKPFDFTVYVQIGSGEQQSVALQTSTEERDQLWDFVLDFCASQR